MNDKDRIENLEEVLAQFLRPIKNLPFPVVVKAMSSHNVLPFDPESNLDNELLNRLILAARNCCQAVKDKPIVRNRPNEVGNDIEPFVLESVSAQGLRAVRPTTSAGKMRSTGYPDILVVDGSNRPTYLECKVYGAGSDFTTMRSFYLSPSDDFKVTDDARHFLIAFAVERRPLEGTIMSEYIPVGYKIVDLHGLLCDVKYEFNSDNKRLYADGMIIAEEVV